MNEINNLQIRHNYYKRFDVLRNITQLLRFRYLAFAIKEDGKKPIMNRYNRGHHHIEFFKTYDFYSFEEIPFLRLYYCLAILRTSFPILPRIGEERTKVKEHIVEHLEEYVLGFDMSWDFDLLRDCPNCSKPKKDVKNKKLFDEEKIPYVVCEKCKFSQHLFQVLEDVIKLTEFFDEYGVSYSVIFSGQRGFHLTIPADELHPELQKDWKRVQNITEKIALFHNDLCIDTFGNDLMKLFKLPYSVDGNPEDFRIVLPLDEKQLRNFNYKITSLNYVRKNIKLLDKNKNPRGLIMHSYKTKERQFENTLNMFRDIEDW